ncbi:MAG: cell division protein FtsQ/DivIB [Moraxella sp.]|nr:cell division protein FtsQ/DivIB [Moraxella sp.]
MSGIMRKLREKATPSAQHTDIPDSAGASSVNTPPADFQSMETLMAQAAQPVRNKTGGFDVFARWKPWQKTLLSWLFVLFVLLCVASLAQKKPALPILVTPEGLSSHELRQLHNRLADFGEQQFYQADLTKISQAVTSLSWVDSARITRDWQSGIKVTVTPKKAVANFGSEHLLDVSGRLFVPADDRMLGDPSLVKLYGSSEDAAKIMQKMQRVNAWFMPLGLSVVDIVVTPRQTWLIRFDSGLRVMVDHERADEKLYRLSMLMKEKQLPMSLKDIAAVDLRYKNGFSLIKKATAAQTQTSSN